MFSRSDTKHACDGQTDRQTDGIAVAYTRYSIYAVARKKNKHSLYTDQLLRMLIYRTARQCITSARLSHLFLFIS